MRRISIVLSICSLLVALVSIAATPKASGTARLIGAGYVEGKGVVFTFQIDGKFSKSDLKGSVTFDGGGNYPLDCVQVDDDTVKCTAPKAVAGHNVTVTWGGSVFWTFVAGIPDQQQYCYDVYDWDDEPATAWVQFGIYCQDEAAVYGDIIIWENPVWGVWPYEYLPKSPDQDQEWCHYSRDGDAYYFPACDYQPEET